MKENKLYECEYCHTSYRDKDKAIECEKNHKHIKGILDIKYLAFKSDKSGIPNKISIEFDDGTKAWFEKRGTFI